jgi:hypothetical protein
MAGGANCVEELECLIAELLTKLQTLRDRQGGSKCRFLLLLFKVDARPLSLVAGRQEGLARFVGHNQMVRQWVAARARKGAATANSQGLSSWAS